MSQQIQAPINLLLQIPYHPLSQPRPPYERGGAVPSPDKICVDSCVFSYYPAMIIIMTVKCCQLSLQNWLPILAKKMYFKNQASWYSTISLHLIRTRTRSKVLSLVRHWAKVKPIIGATIIYFLC